MIVALGRWGSPRRSRRRRRFRIRRHGDRAYDPLRSVAGGGSDARYGLRLGEDSFGIEVAGGELSSPAGRPKTRRDDRGGPGHLGEVLWHGHRLSVAERSGDLRSGEQAGGQAPAHLFPPAGARAGLTPAAGRRAGARSAAPPCGRRLPCSRFGHAPTPAFCRRGPAGMDADDVLAATAVAGSAKTAALQVALKAKGLYPAAVDGIRGPLTRRGSAPPAPARPGG